MEISHKKQDEGSEKPLQEHLHEVADRTREFSKKFNSGGWGYAAGLLHDLGKFSEEFQQYIRKPEEKRRGEVNHSSPGAIAADKKYPCNGRILAYLIAGHHAGLPDYMGGRSSLEQRLKDTYWYDRTLRNDNAKCFLEQNPELKNPDFSPPDLSENTIAASLWVRMLFSCLVDADFLATEKFMEPNRQVSRGGYLTLCELKEKFDAYVQNMKKEASELNQIREGVHQQCANKGKSSGCGIYTLTVPTGGGKTLASMRFALEHAVAQGKDRIIYAIPFTSIIEQTVDVYRKIWGKEAVVEHHSNVQQMDEENDQEKLTSFYYKQRLACENWDAPIVVTTNVQFFESLFAAKPSRCRKLHNIVNSVVILDEAQMLPPGLLKPVLNVITQLNKQYKVTFVLCTATQPAFSAETLKADFSTDGEICADPATLSSKLKRVNIHVSKNFSPRQWEEVAAKIAEHSQVLCVVNTKADCRELYEKLQEKTNGDAVNIHLSTNMCGAHRADKIHEIRTLLKDGKPVRVVSTSLIEAGVDVDFPVVYRSAIGLDSVAQTAGRCNREGKIQTGGNVHVFMPPDSPPKGLMRKGWQAAESLIKEPTSKNELLMPKSLTKYFTRYYGALNGIDEKKIMELLGNPCSLKFRTAAQEFTFIEDSGFPIIVSYGKGAEAIEKLRAMEEPTMGFIRSLQRFTVNVRERHLNLMLEKEDVKAENGIYFLQGGEENYCSKIGLKIRNEIFRPDTVA